jgi:hypothetical protein
MTEATLTETEARLNSHEANVVRSLIKYDPNTGVFTRIRGAGRFKAGSEVGCVAGRYLQINVAGKRYRAHQIALLLVHGYIPNEIDHINGNGLDNRISNLRAVTHQQNNHNQRLPPKHNTTGFLGVSYYKAGDKYSAQINIDGKKKHLGYFKSAIDAHRRYLEVKRKIHITCTI